MRFFSAERSGAPYLSPEWSQPICTGRNANLYRTPRKCRVLVWRTSTRRLENSMRLYDALSIRFKLSWTREVYHHDWGLHCGSKKDNHGKLVSYNVWFQQLIRHYSIWHCLRGIFIDYWPGSQAIFRHNKHEGTVHTAVSPTMRYKRRNDFNLTLQMMKTETNAYDWI